MSYFPLTFLTETSLGKVLDLAPQDGEVCSDDV